MNLVLDGLWMDLFCKQGSILHSSPVKHHQKSFMHVKVLKTQQYINGQEIVFVCFFPEENIPTSLILFPDFGSQMSCLHEV